MSLRIAALLLLLSGILHAQTASDPGPTAAAMTPASSVAPTKAGAVSVWVTRAPEKSLRFEVDVPATIDEVWESMTTVKGMVTWLSPEADVDLRPGGDWIVRFPGHSTGGGTIVDFTPKSRLALRAIAPDQFPTVRRERTDAVFTLSSIDPHTTRVTLTQTGWKDGEEWDKAFNYLAQGNAMLLNGLRSRFITGPVDWKALMEKSPH
jgi:uncharacterized protein YndB with AHSA1/START domain